jgi:hypothetical protein
MLRGRGRSRGHALASDKRIVGRHAAIGIEPDQLALQLVELLRGCTLVVLALGHEKMTGVVEHEARADVGSARQLGLLFVDHFAVLQRVADQATAEHRRAGKIAAQVRLGERQIDPSAALEIRCQRNIEQAGQAADEDRRKTADLRNQPALRAEQEQATGPFGDEDPTIRQETHSPRMIKPSGELGDFDRAALARFAGDCRIARRNRLRTSGRVRVIGAADDSQQEDRHR